MLVCLSIPHVHFPCAAMCGLKPDSFLSQPKSRVECPEFVWCMMLSTGGIAPPQCCLQIDEWSAWGYTVETGPDFVDYVSHHQSQPCFSCPKSCFKSLSIFWLIVVDPTNLGPQINIFISCTIKTKCYAGSQKYEVKQILSFMTVLDLSRAIRTVWTLGSFTTSACNSAGRIWQCSSMTDTWFDF